MGEVDDDEDDSKESGDSPVDDATDLEYDADGSEDATDDPEDHTTDSLRITEEALHAFLALPATREHAAGIVGNRVPRQEVSLLVSEALSDALSASRRPAEERVKAWFDTICRKVVARYHRKRAKRKLREGPMPVASQPTDEAGLPLEDPGDAVVDIDPSFDPEADDFRAEGLLFTRWMRAAVAGDPRDHETWAMMEEWARSEEEGDGKTYEDIAREHDIGVSALKKRIERLKDKYEKRYRQWRKRFMVMLMLLGGAFVIVLAIVVWWLLQPRAPAAVPIAPEPMPSASATPVVLPPLEDNKNIAEPPGPTPPLK